ncbi:Mucin-17 [Wickerhamomyces ciferrii]|uniref:Mucin-17 n=1 Tax=Wickerhamomyces ciferrii (strain ATCC 14091 / BCRC 22168 / CBS 111 / JCM 3599 / NBRC 0793 / NRRL Y-1031 F-60-10) TaxID=1206466 RepID=K0KZJ3_WICCF|nr:Mucin-17 [Wickerhamomyces ciferrii]CCH46754.1 Mucin-17 [Wickerhamomyces ciferrii]
MPSVAGEQQQVPQQANSKPVSAFRQSVTSITSKNKWVSPFRQHQHEQQSNPTVRIGKSEKLKREEAEQAAAEASSTSTTTPAAKKQKSNTSEPINPSIDPKILKQKQAALQQQAETSTSKKIRNEDKLIDLGGGLKMSQAAIDKIARERLAKDLEDIDTKASAQAKLRDQRYQKKLELQALKEENKTNSKFAKFKKKLDLEKKNIQSEHDRKVKEIEATIASLDKQIVDFDKKTKEEIEQSNKDAELATKEAEAKLFKDKETTSKEAANLEKENLQTIHDHQIEQKRSEITTRVLHAKQSEYELELELLELKLAQSKKELSEQTETNTEHTAIRDELESKIAATKSAISENSEKISKSKASQLESARSLKSAESELEASKDSVESLKKQLADLKAGKSDRDARLQEAIAKRKAYDEEQERFRLEAEEKARIEAEEKAKREEEERIRKAEEEERLRKEAEEKKRLEEEERQRKIEEEAKLAEEKKKKHELAVASFGDDLDTRKAKLDTEIAEKKSNGGNVDEIALLELERKHLNSWTYENQTTKDKELGDSLVKAKKDQEIKNKLAEKEAKRKAAIEEKEAKKNAALKAKEEKRKEKEAKKRGSAIPVAAGAAVGTVAAGAAGATAAGVSATDKTASGAKAIASEASKAPTSKSAEPKPISSGANTASTSTSAPVARERPASPPNAKKGERKSRRSSFFGFFKKRNSDDSISPVRDSKTKATAGPLGVPTTTDAVKGAEESTKPETDAKVNDSVTKGTESKTKASTGLAPAAATAAGVAGTAAALDVTGGDSSKATGPITGSSKDLEAKEPRDVAGEPKNITTVDKSTQVEPESAEKTTELDHEANPVVSGKADEDVIVPGTHAGTATNDNAELDPKVNTNQIKDSNDFGASDIENVTGKEFTTSIIKGGEDPILAVKAADPNISLEEITLEQAKREENVLAVVAGHDSTLQEIKRNQLYSAGQSSAPVSKDSDAAGFEHSTHPDATTAPTTAGLADDTTHTSDVPAIETKNANASYSVPPIESSEPKHAYHDNYGAGIVAATGAAGAGYALGQHANPDSGVEVAPKDTDELSPQEASNIYDAHHGAGVLAATSAAGAGYAAGHTEGRLQQEPVQAQKGVEATPAAPEDTKELSSQQASNIYNAHHGAGVLAATSAAGAGYAAGDAENRAQQGSAQAHQSYPKQGQQQRGHQGSFPSHNKPQNAYNNTRDAIIGGATGLGAGTAGGYGAAKAIGRDNSAPQNAPSQPQQQYQQPQQKSQAVDIPVAQHQTKDAEPKNISGIPSDVAAGVLAATGAAGAGYALGHKSATESTSPKPKEEHKFLSNYEEPNQRTSIAATAGTEELKDTASKPSTIPGTQIPVDSKAEAEYDASFAHQAPSSSEKAPVSKVVASGKTAAATTTGAAAAATTTTATSGLASTKTQKSTEQSQYPTGTYSEPGSVAIPKSQKFEVVGGDHLKPVSEAESKQDTHTSKTKPETGAGVGAGLGAVTGAGVGAAGLSKSTDSTADAKAPTLKDSKDTVSKKDDAPLNKGSYVEPPAVLIPESQKFKVTDTFKPESKSTSAAIDTPSSTKADTTSATKDINSEPSSSAKDKSIGAAVAATAAGALGGAAISNKGSKPTESERELDSSVKPEILTDSSIAPKVISVSEPHNIPPVSQEKTIESEPITTSGTKTLDPFAAGEPTEESTEDYTTTSREGTPEPGVAGVAIVAPGSAEGTPGKGKNAKKNKKKREAKKKKKAVSSPGRDLESSPEPEDVSFSNIDDVTTKNASTEPTKDSTLSGIGSTVGGALAGAATAVGLSSAAGNESDKKAIEEDVLPGSFPSSGVKSLDTGVSTTGEQPVSKSLKSDITSGSTSAAKSTGASAYKEPSVVEIPEDQKFSVESGVSQKTHEPEVTTGKPEKKDLGSTLGATGAGAGIGAAVSGVAAKLTGDKQESTTGYQPREGVEIPEDQKLKVQPGVSKETHAKELSSEKSPASTSTPDEKQPSSSGPGIVETAAIAATGVALTGAAVFESTKDKVVNAVSGEANEVQGLGATLKDAKAAENLAQHKDSNRVEIVDSAYYSTLDPKNAGKRLSHNSSNDGSEKADTKKSETTGLGIGAATAGAGAIGAGVASAVGGDQSKSTEKDIKGKESAAAIPKAKDDASRVSESQPLGSKPSTTAALGSAEVASKPSTTKAAASKPTTSTASKPVVKEAPKSEKPEKKFSFRKLFKSDKKSSKDSSPVSTATTPVKKSTDKVTKDTASTTKAATGAATGTAAAGIAAVTAASSSKPETKSGPSTTKDTTVKPTSTESTSKDIKPSTTKLGVESKDVKPSTIAAGTSTSSKELTTTTSKDIKPKTEEIAASSNLGSKSSTTSDSTNVKTSKTPLDDKAPIKDTKPIAAEGKSSLISEEKKIESSKSDIDPSTKEQITGYVGAGLAAAGLTGTAAAISGNQSSSNDVEKSTTNATATTGPSTTGKDSSIAASGEQTTGKDVGATSTTLDSNAAIESKDVDPQQTYDNDSLYSYREEIDYEEVPVNEEEDGLLEKVVKAAVDYTTSII